MKSSPQRKETPNSPSPAPAKREPYMDQEPDEIIKTLNLSAERFWSDDLISRMHIDEVRTIAADEIESLRAQVDDANNFIKSLVTHAEALERDLMRLREKYDLSV